MRGAARIEILFRNRGGSDMTRRKFEFVAYFLSLRSAGFLHFDFLLEILVLFRTVLFHENNQSIDNQI